MRRHYPPRPLTMFFTIAVILCISVFLCCAVVGADTGIPKRLAKVQPGDCAACHVGGKQVLPENHQQTKAMSLKQCLMCHAKGEVPITDKMPTSHMHTLSGISCEKCHGTKSPFSSVDTKTCTTCHNIDSLVKVPDKGANKPNPHNSHYGTDVDCSTCHHQHAKSEFLCAQCHTFTNVTPSPLVQLSFLSKTAEEKATAPEISGKPEPAKEDVAVKKEKVVAAAPEATGTVPDCGTCHSGPKYQQHFARTSHAILGCTVCHRGIRDLTRHVLKKEKPELISCAVCHRDIDKQYSKSYHALVAKISCPTCHTADIHPEKAVSWKTDKVAVIQACTKCHSDRGNYVSKGHAVKVLAGNEDAAACSDCHGIHSTPVFAATDKGITDKRVYYTELCVSCHREGGVAGRYGVFPLAVKAYGSTYHGKVMKLGYLGRVAGCADCHLAHNILPIGDPASVLNPEALVKTCGKCHQGFHPRFVSYVPHPNPNDPKGFLGLYLTKVFMIALLVGVFGFFWIHTLLWWRKAFAEKSFLNREGLQVRSDLSTEESRQYVQRFSTQDRIMHVALILCFFGVIISGFPLKYPGTSWAKAFITLFGSVENAGHVHRISATVMWALFLYACWLSLKFLFPGFRFRGWMGRLFGPDSLFPRIKDFKNCWGMFKWFFNAGEKPEFDRWTYWEKFDYMAVFWGMFIIGFSGLVMWMPELSSYVMPGWMINITLMAHSEEAFLAAVFIFTTHFFHNHLVPGKFPLEMNIFTGSYTIEALKKERPLEYERILEENRLEEIKCPGPGTGIQLFAGVFGTISVLLGLVLTVLIFWAVFTT